MPHNFELFIGGFGLVTWVLGLLTEQLFQPLASRVRKGWWECLSGGRHLVARNFELFRLSYSSTFGIIRRQVISPEVAYLLPAARDIHGLLANAAPDFVSRILYRL